MAGRVIPLFKVHHPKGVGSKLEEVFSSGSITEGEYSDRFEKELGEYIGNPNCSLVNSCTSAITLALHLAGVQKGDEVISSAMTCMATNEPIYHCGAKIVWADIDRETGNISPASIEKRITPKTKAIIAVHWAGQPFEIEKVQKIAKAHNLKVIEDAAHALDAEYKNCKIGTHSDFVCFSFQAIKHLTTGDGGALFCKNPDDYERAKLLRWFGLNRKYQGSKWEQDITEAGYKFHMNNLTAIIGLEQMKHINKLTGAHIANGKFYDQHIKNPSVTKLQRSPSSTSASWIYSVLCDERDRLQEHLAAQGISSDVVHMRNDKYSVFKNFQNEDLPNLDYFAPRLLNIPVGWWLTEEDRQHIANTVNSF
jgi:perosamine synthetase